MGTMLLWACAVPSYEAESDALQACDQPDLRSQIAATSDAFEVPVCLHAVWPSEEIAGRRFTADLEDSTAKRHIDRVNRVLAGAPNGEGTARTRDTGIRLVLDQVLVHGDPELVLLGRAEDHQAGVEALADAWQVEDCVNVYVLFDDGMSESMAWASYPGTPDRGGIVTVNKPGERTLAHEWGHILGLRHTHEQDFGAEWDGDCDVTGDLLCDTPPDPGPELCRQWIDSATEESWVDCPERLNHLESRIPLDNLMSYWEPPWTSQGFSGEQIERMHCTWSEGRDQVIP